jgi:methyl coenzyme M reductase subunit D
MLQHLKKQWQEEQQALPTVTQRTARFRYSSKLAKLTKSCDTVNQQLKYGQWEAAMVQHFGEAVTLLG